MDGLPTVQYLNIGQEYEAAEDEKNVAKSLRNYVIALEKDLDLFGGMEVTNVKETRTKGRGNRTPFVTLGCVNEGCPFYCKWTRKPKESERLWKISKLTMHEGEHNTTRERGSKRKARRSTSSRDGFSNKLAKVTDVEHDLLPIMSAAVQNMTEEMDTVIMDIGGTGSRAALFSSSAELLVKAEGPGANPYRVGKAETARIITHLLHQLSVKSIDRLVIGMAGITCPDSLDSVRSGIAASGVSIDKHYAWLMSDAELTHIAAFGFGGPDAATGVLLIGGTGSIALARPVGNPHAIIRAGGLGYKCGDEGSGHWIGIKLLEQCSQTPDLELALCNELNVSAEQLQLVEPSIVAVALDTLSSSYIAAANVAAEAGVHLTNLCVEVQGLNQDLSRVKCYGSVLKKSRYVRHAFQQALNGTGFQDEGDVGDVLRESAPALIELQGFPIDPSKPLA
jgi:hypothetical protein